ncbi:MAG TPA: phosphatidylglycerophosphatase A [Candidatus Deferrimicrobiaceae bacterium]|nr:phosphatidylglycerophosphatase A [Candidatus Deferrimicrobiaceae bacterium]
MGAEQVNRFRENRWVRAGLRAVATGFGAGRVPVAPGTAGSLVGVLLWYWSGGWGVRHLLLLGAIFLLSVPAAREEIAATRSPDPGSVVIDEIAGMVLAATGIPWSVRSALLLFLLFRVFDVFKFGPAAWLDARKGAVYVVADDLAAGLYAGLAYRGIAWLTG